MRALVSATLIKTNLTATQRFVLVDLSDTTNYKHQAGSTIRLLEVRLTAERRDGAWAVRWGIVKENDATDGSATWLDEIPIRNDDQATDDHTYRNVVRQYCKDRDFGLELQIASGALTRSVSNLQSGDQTWLQNDAANLEDATGATNKSAGPGDIVLEAEEVTDGGALDLTVEVLYLVV